MLSHNLSCIQPATIYLDELTSRIESQTEMWWINDMKLITQNYIRYITRVEVGRVTNVWCKSEIVSNNISSSVRFTSSFGVYAFILFSCGRSSMRPKYMFRINHANRDRMPCTLSCWLLSLLICHSVVYKQYSWKLRFNWMHHLKKKRVMIGIVRPRRKKGSPKRKSVKRRLIFKTRTKTITNLLNIYTI